MTNSCSWDVTVQQKMLTNFISAPLCETGQEQEGSLLLCVIRENEKWSSEAQREDKAPGEGISHFLMFQNDRTATDNRCVHDPPVAWWWLQLRLHGWSSGTARLINAHLRCQGVCPQWGNPDLPNRRPSKTAWSSLRGYAQVKKSARTGIHVDLPLSSSFHSQLCMTDKRTFRG